MDWDRPQDPFHTITFLASPSGASFGFGETTRTLMTGSRRRRRMGRLLPLALALAIAVVPSVAAQTFDLASGSAYGLRVDAEYRLGPQDTAGHEAGAWGAGAPAPYANSGRDWVFAAVEPLSAPIHLDSAGMVKVSAWMGGGDGELGQHDVAWELKAGETVIAVGEAKELMFVMEIVELTWEVAPDVATIDPSMGDLTFRVFTTGVGHGLRINLGETPGWTQITLPLLAESGSPMSSTSTSAATNSSSSSSTSSSETSTGPTSSSTTTLRDDSTPTSSDSESTSESSSSGNATDDGSKDSPAPPLALAGLAVVAAAVAVRRRLR